MLCLFAVSLLLGLAANVEAVSNTEAKLWKQLSADGIAAFKPNGRTDLKTSIQLVTLSDYDHIRGSAVLGYWMSLQWVNPSFQWNPEEFDGVTNIRVPSSDLWVPDFVPYVHTSTEYAISTNVVISSNGEVFWVPYLITTILCYDVSDGPRYPRDEKVCQLKIGSWTYDGNRLNISLAKKPTDNEFIGGERAIMSSGWRFKSASQVLQTKMYTCCPEPYQSIITNITIERMDNYYGLAVSVPGALTGLAVSFLFLVSPSSPARLISQMICFLILVFVGVTDIKLMGNTVRLAPAAHYYMAVMFLNLAATLWTILASVMWMQLSLKGSGGRGFCDSILSKLECICCLPGAMVGQDEQQLQIEEKTGEDSRHRMFALSAGQRLILTLDRLFCLITFVLLLFLFIYLGS